jgi:general secretion pathway protein I
MTSPSKQKISGFTLIEVLLALAVIAIALTALLRANAQNISNSRDLKEKVISHWIAMQGVTMMQLNLIPITTQSTQATQLFGKLWYWRAKIISTPLQQIKQVILSVSTSQSGPFREEVTAYLYS